jgi:hypothetical protein
MCLLKTRVAKRNFCWFLAEHKTFARMLTGGFMMLYQLLALFCAHYIENGDYIVMILK